MSDSPIITLDFDASASRVVISGDIPRLLKKSLFAQFLRRQDYSRNSDSVVSFPIDQSALDSVHQQVIRLAEKLQFEITDAPNLSAEMKLVRQKQKNFEAFSQQALGIWQGSFDQSDFEEFSTIVQQACPGRTFYPLQLLSAYHLSFSQNACNFSVPGAGKTSIVYASYAYLSSLPPNDPRYVNHLLIVGPLAAFSAWETEYNEIFDVPIKSKRLAGFLSSAERSEYLRNISPEALDKEVTLTSYQTLSNNESEFGTFLSAKSRKVMLVLDEAHYIKGFDGVWSGSALSLAPLASSRVVLTGTPAPNGYEDLQNLFHFIYPERNLIGFSRAQLLDMTSSVSRPEAIAMLNDNLRPYYTRIKKSDLHLPGIKETVISVGMSPEHQRIYEMLERRIVPQLERDNETIDASLFRARLIRLRQAATNPELLVGPLADEEINLEGQFGGSIAVGEMGKQIRQFRSDVSLRKLSALLKLVRDLRADNQKILIWSVFIANLELIKKACGPLADYVEVIHGGVPVEFQSFEETGTQPETEYLEEEITREMVLKRFRRSDESSILVANPMAVGESISLHKECHVAIYFDRDFNAGRFVQSKDRIHRYGLPDDQVTNYYYFVTDNTVDVDIHDRLVQKETRMVEFVESEEIPLFKIAKEDSNFRNDIQQIIWSYEARKLRS